MVFQIRFRAYLLALLLIPLLIAQSGLAAAPYCHSIFINSTTTKSLSTQASEANRTADEQATDIKGRSLELNSLMSSGRPFKGSSAKNPYDLVIVGSGPHAAIALRTARKLMPKASILVISKEEPGAVFRDRRDYFFINSPELGTATSNELQGSRSSLADFDNRRFHPAGNLGDHIVRSIYDRKADYLTGVQVDGLKSTSEGKSKNLEPTELTLSNGKKIFSRATVVAVGLGEAHYGFKDPAAEATARSIAESQRSLPLDTPRAVETFDDHSARIQKLVAAGQNPLDAYRGRTVLVAGWGGDAANVLAEAMDGWAPGYLYGKSSAGQVGVQNGETRVGSGKNEIHLMTCGGVWEPADYLKSAKARYHSTVPNIIPRMIQIRGKIVGIKKVARRNGNIKLILTDDQGNSYQVDHYIAAVGYRPVFNNLFQGNPMQAITAQVGEGAPSIVALGSESIPGAIAVGPAIGPNIPKGELDNTITKNPASINVLGPRTEQAVANQLQKVFNLR